MCWGIEVGPLSTLLQSRGYCSMGWGIEVGPLSTLLQSRGYCSMGYCNMGYCSMGYCSRGYCSMGYCSMGYCSRGYCSMGYCSRGYCSMGYCSRGYCSMGYCSLYCEGEWKGSYFNVPRSKVVHYEGARVSIGTSPKSSVILSHFAAFSAWFPPHTLSVHPLV
jgi:hypothetical protein